MNCHTKAGAAAILLSFARLRMAEAAEVSLPWRSPLLEMTEVRVDKVLLADAVGKDPSVVVGRYEPLPPAMVAALGSQTVDYESFAEVRLSTSAVLGATTAASLARRPLVVLPEREIQMPWGSIRPGDPSSRFPKTSEKLPSAYPVAGRYLVHFAFDPTAAWYDRLEACGARIVTEIDSRTLLVAAEASSAIIECDISKFVAWVDSYYSVDRLGSSMLTARGGEFWLQFPGEVRLVEKSAYASPEILVLDAVADPGTGFGYLHVAAELAALRKIIETDLDLLAIDVAGQGAPSDERQGRIITGFHNGTQLTGGPGYRSWLSSRGLLSTVNAPVVGVFDTGYDNGANPGTHHLDMETPDRIVGLRYLTNAVVESPSNPDSRGHGSMVAGIIAGDASVGVGSGTADPQNYLLGMGIAPTARIYSVFPSSYDLVTLPRAFELSQANGALIANHSWNEFDPAVPAYTPRVVYTPIAQLYDQRVLDSNPLVPGNQPMTSVVSAGNFVDTCNGLLWGTVSSPATAKNVIVVGATGSYRPVAENPTISLACKPCDGGFTAGRPKNLDGDNVSTVAAFSSRGVQFGPSPMVARANTTRIKPDLVAPGVRVFSSTSSYFGYSDGSSVACQGFWPIFDVAGTRHTYGSGTSFAAPVVSGVAALFQQMLKNQVPSVVASASLTKAALIATADSLGGGGGSDHRPSAVSGWGRVNLNRLTDTVSKYMRNEVAADTFTVTGQTRTFVLRAPTDNKDVYVVLSWSDAPGTVTGVPTAPLRNDLGLAVQLGAGSIGGYYYGNYFNEAVSALDDGLSKNYITDLGVGGDHINTVEAVFVPASAINANGLLRITVKAEGIGPTLSQPFSVYVYNGVPCVSGCESF